MLQLVSLSNKAQALVKDYVEKYLAKNVDDEDKEQLINNLNE